MSSPGTVMALARKPGERTIVPPLTKVPLVTAPLIAALRQGIQRLSDPTRAAQQQAYMKSAMPYAGLTAPVLRQLCRDVFKAHPIDKSAHWYGCARTLWDDARTREERYAAIELLAVKRYRKLWYTPDSLPIYRHMIETGAWWDYVDNIASNHVGALWLQFGPPIKRELTGWINDPHLWIRRTAILAQLKHKDQTDLAFLHRAIQGSITDKDFFARKAIGWALRAYSYTDPDWVSDYIDQHRTRLSPLSTREGMKAIVRKSANS